MSDRKLLPGQQIKMQPLGKCPCGQEIAASIDPDTPAVSHAEPCCPKFLELEPDEFLTYVRRSRGLPEPSDK